jgi:hypothetical protein
MEEWIDAERESYRKSEALWAIEGFPSGAAV